MAEGAPKKNWSILWFLLGFGVLIGANALGLRDLLLQLVWNISDDIDTKLALSRLYKLVATFVSISYTTTLFVSTLAATVGSVVRTLVRARVRTGLADPLDRLRSFVAARSRLTTTLLAAPPVLFVALLLRLFTGGRDAPWDTVLAGAALPALFTILAQVIIARRGMGALLAPTLSEEEMGDTSADGFTFTAVAVTTETLGAVGGLAVLSIVMLGLSMSLKTTTLTHSPVFGAALVAYLAVAGGGAMLFRRASRISVGLDGIHVSGSSRARFIPFREIDEADTNGHTIELKRGTRIVLRLQLHGEDAIRRTALKARINAAIAKAVAQRDAPAVAFVSSASSDAIGRAAGGASSYREAPPDRERLWEALESPAVDAAGRKAAATALARDGDRTERARLRVAAEHCAEPSVRARIEELLASDHSDHEDEEPARALKVRRV